MNAWEITLEDVRTVLASHGVELPKKKIVELHGELNHEGIIDTLLNYDGMEQQSQSMLDDIENHLLEEGIVTGKKKFCMETQSTRPKETLADIYIEVMDERRCYS